MFSFGVKLLNKVKGLAESLGMELGCLVTVLVSSFLISECSKNLNLSVL